MKRAAKITSLLLIGFVVGIMFAYGFMWYQAYRKLDTVWTCQVFVGALSIEEQEMCDQYNPAHPPRYY